MKNDLFSTSYFVFYSKSTLIRQAARKVGRGVIYVEGNWFFNSFLIVYISIRRLVPYNVEKFGFAFARAIHFHFKEHLRLSNWIETKMFGSPPDDGTEYFRLYCEILRFLLSLSLLKVMKLVGNVF